MSRRETRMDNMNELIGPNAGEVKKTRNMFIDFSPVPECRNKDSYGTICTRCNRCGRFNVKLRNGRKL